VHQQVAQDVFLCLDGEALIISVGVVDELAVEVGPDGAGDFTAELEDAEAAVLVARLPIF